MKMFLTPRTNLGNNYYIQYVSQSSGYKTVLWTGKNFIFSTLDFSVASVLRLTVNMFKKKKLLSIQIVAKGIIDNILDRILEI